MKFRFVLWDVLPCKIIVDRRFRGTYSSLMTEAVRTYETSADNHFTRQYNPEDSSEHHSKVTTMRIHFFICLTIKIHIIKWSTQKLMLFLFYVTHGVLVYVVSKKTVKFDLSFM
jgi:hypothetical protein